MNLEALLHTCSIQKQQSVFPTLFIKWIFFHVKVTDGNNDGLCVLICHPCRLQAPERAGRPEHPPILRSDLWQFLCRAISPCTYSSHQVWLKTEMSGLNITLTEEKKLSVKRGSGVQKEHNRRHDCDMCRKSDTVQCNSEILPRPSICPEPDGLTIVIC